MPLISSLSSFADELVAAYSDVGSEKSSAVFAQKRAKAIHNFVKSAMPMTLITMPGPVGTGIGGLDKPAPGMGLEAALPLLSTQLVAAWSHGGAVGSPKAVALKEAQAIMAFVLQAIVMTKDEGPITPPSMSGPTTGEGGIGSMAPGKGLEAALPDLEKELLRIWSDVGSEVAVPELAMEYSKAILAFVKAAKVKTTGAVGGGAGASIVGELS